MEKRRLSYSTITIIVLLILVGVIFTYMYFENKQMEKNAITKEKEIREKSVKEKTKEKKEVETEKEVAIDSDVVKLVEANTDKIGSYTKYINYDVKTLTKRNLIDTALNGLNDDQITFCITQRTQIKATITIADLNKSLNKYVPDAKLTINDLIENKGETSLRIKDYGYGEYSLVIEGEDIHVIGGCDGRGTTILAENIVSSPVKAVTKGDTLYIYRKVAFGKISGLTYNYYTDQEKTDFVENIGINANPTWEKYKTYKSTYEKNNENYYLISTVKEQ